MLKTEQYYELDQEIIDYFKKIEQEFIFAIDFKYIYQTNNKQKKLISIKKIADNYAILLNAELIVTINDIMFEQLDEEIKTILFEQELDKIITNLEKGTFSISQPTLKTSMGIIKKHSYEQVERANETERLLAKGDKENE
jgi:pyruvate/2-oxoglutarate/acetoin dehydrogenase E1 component